MSNPSAATGEPRRRTATTTSPRSAAAKEASKDPSELSKTIASQLANLQYECANCLEVIQGAHPTWHCLSCFRVFHLKCIKKWAQQEESGEGRSFRCPHCQAPQKPVTRYRCFCSKMVDPPYDPMLSCPHTCGNTCGRRRGEGCPHPCGNQCHPGPCPDCSAMAPSKRCPCERTAYTYRCGKPDPMTTCDGICGKKLNCGVHACDRRCHHGPCPPCAKPVVVVCACGRAASEQVCGSGGVRGGVKGSGSSASGFHCDQVCGKLQQCGVHHCNVVCHSGPCPPCDRDPSIVATCPCGKEALVVTRTSCKEAIPSCGNVCGRSLSCGRHYCEQLCHDSPCPPCEHKSQVHCPCRSSVAKMYCRDADAFRCSKKCKTKMTCGKHECDSICCKARNVPDAPEHRCTRLCGKKLPCGHPCAELCHRGPCPACPNIIVAPLTCRCGVELLMPPLPCGTPPPACRLPCLLARPCGHPAGDHVCHHGDCPPCTKPVTRMCAGGHKELTNVLCSAEYACCVEPCDRALDCGHVCQRPCHPGNCIESAAATTAATGGAAATKRAACSQPCGKPLPCGHSCKQRCHASSSAPCGRCQEAVELRCECGLRCEKLPCAQYLKRLDEHRQSSAADKPFSLPCNDDCLFEQRLSILRARAAPKPEGFGKVIYSLKLWSVGEKSPEVVAAVEERLLEFVKGKELSLMLPAMQKEKRAVVHELCQYFHIHSESQDQEPNRTVFLTKTVRTSTPNPLLTQALRHGEQQHPALYVESVLKRPDEAQKRIVVLEGEGLNPLEAARALTSFAGDFVLYEPSDTDLLEPRRRPVRRTGCAEDLTPMTTYYAVFLPHRAKVAYEQLRQRGSTVLYHLLGFAWPPKQFAWEPTRPEWSGGVGGSQHSRGSAPASAVAVHGDPGSSAFAVQRRGNEKTVGGTWANLVQQQGGSSAAEKAKKRQEAERRVEVGNRFSALGGK